MPIMAIEENESMNKNKQEKIGCWTDQLANMMNVMDAWTDCLEENPSEVELNECTHIIAVRQEVLELQKSLENLSGIRKYSRSN